jgi:hypothetical protein
MQLKQMGSNEMTFYDEMTKVLRIFAALALVLEPCDYRLGPNANLWSCYSRRYLYVFCRDAFRFAKY